MRNQSYRLELFTQEGLRRAKRSTTQLEMDIQELADEEDHSRSSLKDLLRRKDLEDLFSYYQMRVQFAFLQVYLIVCTAFDIVSMILLLVTCQDPEFKMKYRIASLAIESFLSVLLCTLIKEKHFTKRPLAFPIVSFFSILIFLLGHLLPFTMDGHNSPFVSRGFMLIMATYILLPLKSDFFVLLSAACISALEIVVCNFFLYPEPWQPRKMIMDFVFFLLANVIGMHVRSVRELSLRISLVNKCICIENTLMLQYEKQKEENLVAAILPEHISDRVLQDVRNCIRRCDENQKSSFSRKPFKALYVERFRGVTILCADIVNFTWLTTTLTPKQLVDLLNALYGKFDKAAKENSCRRIKIVGDSYYAVCGVPLPVAQHARNCIKLGIDMIKIIREVQNNLRLDIDMRIGVHTGNVLSGVIGLRKWHHDLWSKDFQMASRLESSGSPGFLHISEQTKAYLDSRELFFIARNPSSSDELLKSSAQTFLVQPKFNISPRPFMKKFNNTGLENTQVQQRRKAVNVMADINDYKGMMQLRHVQLEKEISELPLSIKRWKWKSSIHPFLLTPSKGRLAPRSIRFDPFFKLHLVVVLLILLGMSVLSRLGFPEDLTFLFVGCAQMALVALVIPFAWFRYLWYAVHDPRRELQDIRQPGSTCAKWMMTLSSHIQESHLRTAVFVLLGSMLGVQVLLSKECVYQAEDSLYDLRFFRVMCTLALSCMFVFYHVHYMLKLVFMTSSVATFIFKALVSCPLEFHFDWTGPSQEICLLSLSHVIFMLDIFIIFHLFDRQSEYLFRLNCLWKRRLNEQQQETNETRIVCKILLENILPSHVGKVKNSYHEAFDDVAVMFASIQNLFDEFDCSDEDVRCLHLLNEIVCDFDLLLYDPLYKGIEKIKLIGSTYMAACGLRILDAKQLGDNSSSLSIASLDPQGDRDSGGASPDKQHTKSQNLLTLIGFSMQMMKMLDRFNVKYNYGLQLKVGILGTQSPFYDIWGDTVNMASRLESNGKVGKIQVSETEAQHLSAEGVPCEFRGTIHIKGKGLTNVYFVDTGAEALKKSRNSLKPGFDRLNSLAADCPTCPSGEGNGDSRKPLKAKDRSISGRVSSIFSLFRIRPI